MLVKAPPGHPLSLGIGTAQQRGADEGTELEKSGCISLLWLPHRLLQTKWLNDRRFFPHDSGGYKSEGEVSAGLFCSEASLLGLQMAVFYLCVHVVFLLCSSSKRTPVIGLGPTPMNSTLITS